MGPIEYVVLRFRSDERIEKVAYALRDLVDAGRIRVLDLVFIVKDTSGNVETFEYDDLDAFAAFSQIDGEVGGVLGLDDIEYVGEGLEPDSSGVLMVWEDVWAAPLVGALAETRGTLVEGGRIPHDLIEPVLSEVATSP